MKTATRETTISKDLTNKKLQVVREFDADVQRVWKAWTESDLLEQWWAPKPWKAVTKTMDFTEGGAWFYYMEGPAGERHYCRTDYKTIDQDRSFTSDDAFCDENGIITSDLSPMHWDNKFSETETGTKVEIEITYEDLEDMEKIIEMGFIEGFTAAHRNLDEMLANGTH